jgi:hypothetical protein
MVVRIIDKRGRVLYRDTNRGRFVKLKDWTRQFSKAKAPEPPPQESLSKRERASIRSNRRIRFNGKFITKLQESFVKKDLEKTGKQLVNNDLVKTFGKEVARDILSGQYTRWVNSEAKNNFNVERELIRALKQGFGIKYKIDGREYIGMDAILRLKEREAELVNESIEEGMKSPVILYLIKEDRATGDLLIDDEDTEVVGS